MNNTSNVVESAAHWRQLVEAEAVLKRLGEQVDPALEEQVSAAWLSKIAALRALERHAEAIEACNALASRFNADAGGLHAPSLVQADAREEAAARGLQQREAELEHQAAAEPVVVVTASPAMSQDDRDAVEERIDEAKRLGKTEPHKAIALLDQLIDQCKGTVDPELRRQRARAFFNKGYFLNELKEHDSAITCLRELDAIYGADPSMPLRELVAQGLNAIRYALRETGQDQEAFEANADIVRRFDGVESPKLRINVATALFFQGCQRRRDGRYDECFAYLDDVLARTRGSSESEMKSLAARALTEKAVVFEKLGRHEEELAAYAQVVERFGEDRDAAMRKRAMSAVESIARTHGELGDKPAQLAAYRRMLTQFGSLMKDEKRARVCHRLLELEPQVKPNIVRLVTGSLGRLLLRPSRIA